MIYLTYGIKDTARNKVRDDFATYTPEKKRRLAHLNRADASLFKSIPGPYEIFNELVDQIWPIIMAIDYGPAFQVIGAWDADDQTEEYCKQFGTEWALDVDGSYILDGDGIPTTTGTPIYPLHNKLRDIAPDRYNESGQLPRPTINQEALNIMNVVAGQSVRLA